MFYFAENDRISSIFYRQNCNVLNTVIVRQAKIRIQNSVAKEH